MSGCSLIRDTELQNLEFQGPCGLRLWLMLLRVNSGGKCKLHVGSGTREPQNSQNVCRTMWILRGHVRSSRELGLSMCNESSRAGGHPCRAQGRIV